MLCMYVAVVGAVSGLVSMIGVVWVAFVVVFWNTDFSIVVAVGAVMMVGIVVVVAVAVVGGTVVAIKKISSVSHKTSSLY